MANLKIQEKMHPGLYETEKKTRTTSQSFGDVIERAVRHVNNAGIQADQSVKELLRGNAGIHETMIALQKADIPFRLLLQVRNKVMDAYREIMRMPF